ncbi:MAG: hypothetical protein ACK50Q_00535 [Labrys sp. (in: a-proteobacteria)]|jgi:hypothetical protein
MGVVFGIMGIVVALVVLFKLAIFAVPFFVGMQAFMWAMETGAGPIGAVVAGGAAGVTTLVLAQLLFANIRMPPVRMALALGFGIPAAIAGYHVVFGVASLSVSSDVWRIVFALIGGAVAGVSATLQLMALGEATTPERGAETVRPQPPVTNAHVPDQRQLPAPPPSVALLPPPDNERSTRLT